MAQANLLARLTSHLGGPVPAVPVQVLIINLVVYLRPQHPRHVAVAARWAVERPKQRLVCLCPGESCARGGPHAQGAQRVLVVARTEGVHSREGVKKNRRQTKKTAGEELERGGRLVEIQTVPSEICV